MKIKIPTLQGLAYKYTLIAAGAIILSPSVTYFFKLPQTLQLPLFLLLLFLIIITDIFRFVPARSAIKHRAESVSALLPVSSYSSVTTPPPLTAVFRALERLKDSVKSVHSIATDAWSFSDYGIERYQEYRGYRFLANTTYYSVIRIPLPRALPHIIFDSKKMRGSQMRFSFDTNQKISLEGNFDTYFDTYFPANYEIDLLSIITPEVMEQLIVMSAFDIEIHNSTLYFYAPLVPASQVPQAINNAVMIRDKLSNNILTYSDSRLAVDARKTVHIYGKSIQADFRLKAAGLALGGCATFIFVPLVLAFNAGSWDIYTPVNSIYLLSGFILMLGGIGSAVYTLKDGYSERERRRRLDSHVVGQ